MKPIKKLIVALLLLLLLVYCILFAINNNQVVPIDLILVDIIHAPLSVLSLGLLILGFAIGSVLSFATATMRKVQINRLKRQLDSLQKQMGS